jgi:TDG/mug DNA glycosylase family protein
MAQGLDVLICGINPSLYSAAVGHHFARPGNRFWPALAGAGITPRRLMPWEDQYLAVWGYGLTNLVARATARADELSPEELQAGFRRLTGKLRRYRVGVLAVLGISAYRIALGKPRAVMGPQEETIAGAQVWVLPNPSGLNAHYQLPELSRLYRQLHQAARKGSAPRTRG